MKNFIKEILVILTVIVCVVIYVEYFLIHDYIFTNRRLLFSTESSLFAFQTWHVAIFMMIVTLWIIFLIWQIFTQFRKLLRNYIFLFLTNLTLTGVLLTDNRQINEVVELSKGSEGWVIYPPLSALPQAMKSTTEYILTEEITWQLRVIQIILGCLCLFLVYRIYQNNRNVLN
jgi:hypothetical protein